MQELVHFQLFSVMGWVNLLTFLEWISESVKISLKSGKKRTKMMDFSYPPSEFVHSFRLLYALAHSHFLERFVLFVYVVVVKLL